MEGGKLGEGVMLGLIADCETWSRALIAICGGGHLALWEVQTLRLSENASVNLVTCTLRMSVSTPDE